VTPADLQTLRETRELLDDVDRQIDHMAELLGSRLDDVAELHDTLHDRDDGSGTWLDDADLTLLRLCSGFVVMLGRHSELHAGFAAAGALSPESN
jgi:hypothetical protein